MVILEGMTSVSIGICIVLIIGTADRRPQQPRILIVSVDLMNTECAHDRLGPEVSHFNSASASCILVGLHYLL
jgi:hypothetical protein